MKKLLLFLTFLLIGTSAFASSVSYDEIIWQYDPALNPASLSAEINFYDEIAGDNAFQIELINTSVPNTDYISTTSQYPSSLMLTGLGFELDNNWITGGSVLANYLQNSSVSNPSPYWGYDNAPITKGYFQDEEITALSVNTVVSTMTAATEQPFLGSANTIQGPNWGVLPSNFVTNAYPYFSNRVLINITLNSAITDWTGFIDYVNRNDVSVAFGSPTAAPVPEPATLLLFGTGLVGLAGIGRKRFGKK